MRFLIGVVVGVIAVFVAGYFIATSGKISVAANQSGFLNEKIDSFLDSVSEKSIEVHAKPMSNPFAQRPEAVQAGLLLYKKSCLSCHGAGQVEGAKFTQGMNPQPPMLDMKSTQKMSDGEFFWIISNGIRSTGMPSFSATHTSDEIWQMVAFVRHLPKLTDTETAALKAAPAH